MSPTCSVKDTLSINDIPSVSNSAISSAPAPNSKAA